MSLYWKSNPTTPLSDTAPVTADSEHSLLALLYTDAALRTGTLLFAIWSAKGWGPVAFGTLVRGGIPPVFANLADPNANANPDPVARLRYLSDRPTPPLPPLLRMSTITQLSRAQIANVAGQAHGPWLQHLQPRDRVRVLVQLATLYACLGFRRKEVYILREVLATVVDLVVCAREEGGSGAGAGRRSMAVSSGMADGGGGWSGMNRPEWTSSLGHQDEDGQSERPHTGDIGVRMAEATEGNESILRIVKYVCEIYGISMARVQVDGQEAGDDTGEDEELDLEIPKFGWREVQIGVVREAVQIAEALPGQYRLACMRISQTDIVFEDHRAVAQLALTSLRQLNSWMSPGDQHHLYTLASRSLATAHRRGDAHKIDFWSWKPVVSVEVVP